MLKTLRHSWLLTLVGVGLVHAAPEAPTATRLLRFPTTNGREVAFCYAGQLYSVPMGGGVARRLTTAPGYVSFPRFSTDGAQIAFTAQYDGNTEVYVMPAPGGVPKRLTYSATLGRDDISDRMGPNNLVMAWKNTKPEIAYRSRMRSYNDFIGALYTVGLDAELPQQLPVPRGGFLSFSPDDSKIAYNRVFREFRTWKQYRGGQADEIWIYDLKSGALENITQNLAQDIIPMWGPNNKIYFLSDRDGRLNLYSYDLATKKTAQHTAFKDFDIKFPSLGGGKVVFEEAGEVWAYDLATNQAQKLSISVAEDMAGARDGLVNVTKFIASVSPAPDGKRIAVDARGEIFSVPQKDGAIRNLTQTPGVHERNAIWSPDGKTIAYIGDATGENEIYLQSQDRSSGPVQITSNAKTYFYHLVWSPDSKRLLWADRLQALHAVDVATKAVTDIDKCAANEIRQYGWSPDSKWITYTKQDDGVLSQVFIYSLESAKSTAVTDGWYGSNSSSFSDDGKTLYFSSGRDFKPLYSDIEWDHVYINTERIYGAVLAKDTPSPFQPKSDEVAGPKEDTPTGTDSDGSDTKKTDGKDGAPDPKAKDAKIPKVAPAVKIDLDGIANRVFSLPIVASNYGDITAFGDKVYYLRAETEADGDEDAGPPGRTLALYDLKAKKETVLGKVGQYEITADRKKMLVKTGRDFALIDLPDKKIEIKDKLDLSSLEMTIDHHAEWNQIYAESWRQMRDFFYAPNMNGVNWPQMRDKYATLLPYVANRNDLTYIMGELIGELHNGHSYVGGGDRKEAPRVRMGLLGAELSRDPTSRAYRIDRILKGENWGTSRSPFTEIGVDVHEGEYILAVDGRPVASLPNIQQALINTVDRPVILKIGKNGTDASARNVTVRPIGDEAPLYYYSWVQKNTQYVSDKTGGKVGYIHIPDMGPAGLNEFVKHFFPQLRKQALIIDDRGNGGGNVSPMIIERLHREMVMVEIARNQTPQPNPAFLQVGPKVMLIDEFSASDGDIFPFRFQQLHMGKTIGKRTWGGVVGIRGTLPFTDGGFLNRPEFAPYSKDGKGWVIESHGVDPDIIVDNDPAREFHGEDQQLDRGIQEALAELQAPHPTLPPVPAYPDRSNMRD